MELILFNEKQESKDKQNQEITIFLDAYFNEYQTKLDMIKGLSEQTSDYSSVINYFLNANEVRLSYNNLFY